MRRDISLNRPRSLSIRYDWEIPSPIRLVVMATAYTAAALVMLFAVTTLFVIGTAIGGTVLTFKGLRWALRAHRPRLRRLPASLRQTALAADIQEAQLLATSALHRMFEEALSVDPSAIRRNGKKSFRKISVEARELARLLFAMQKSPRIERSSDIAALQRLLDRADAVAGYARRGVKANKLNVDQLWILQRERVLLAQERDALIDELIAWKPARTSRI